MSERVSGASQAIPGLRTGGAARLKLTLTDGAGNAKSYTRTVHVHALK